MNRKQPEVGEEGAHVVHPQPRRRLEKTVDAVLTIAMFDERIIFLPLLCFAIFGGMLLGGCTPPADEINATGAWMRAVPADAIGAVYLEIHNPTDEPQRLIAARFEDAGATELHETVQDPKRRAVLAPEHLVGNVMVGAVNIG